MLDINFKKIILSFILCLYPVEAVFAAIAQSPLFLTQDVPPIVMLTMGRDHKLYYEAYNDASDLNEDNILDTTYKPDDITYFGYFDSYKCYKYKSNSTPGFFKPSSITADKKCSGSNEWSGDFLNYLTTSRMDALRKVLYGGYRSTDTTKKTILKRAFIPQDAHSWGKEYTSIAVNGYDIRDYTPLPLPNSGKRHLFASTTLSSNGDPKLRVLKNKTKHIWDWVSKESPVADNSLGTPKDYDVYVKVCVSGKLEDNCKAYSDGNTTTYKPTGLLQDYGDDDTMAFGLLTGSFKHNTAGGVLRKNISSFTNEIDPKTGIFTNVNGIVATINKLRIATYDYAQKNYAPGWPGAWQTQRPINDGEAQDWGNPVAEMMYEGLRYFSGKASPTSDFSSGVGDKATVDSVLGLALPGWQDPYRSSGGYERCAKPIQMVISDINPSYDTDQLPGSSFNSYSGDISTLNVSDEADTIWDGESEAANIFIGESNGVSDGSPSPKAVDSFKNIRGLTPEEPTKLGGFYSASIAYFGHKTDLNPADDEQKMDTYAVALASPLPRINIPVADKIITLVPFAKSPGGCLGITPDPDKFQPTNQIVDFYVEEIVNTSAENMDSSVNGGRPYGKFKINFEDVEQAADHDMDAIAEYKFEVTATNTVKITLEATYASGCIIQHMGYVISGTTADGTYLEIRDYDTGAGSDVDFFLDTPPGVLPGGTWNDGVDLPLTATREFTPGTTTAASFIKHDPLWYAAKWGGFSEEEKAENRPAGTSDPNNKPDQAYEWDSDGDGNPDNYFLVTNAGNLKEQLSKAFSDIASKVSSSAAVATNSTRLDTNTKIYQARFDSSNWSGQFLAFNINTDGTVGGKAWDAAEKISTDHTLRKIYSYDPIDANADSVKGMPFLWSELSTSQQSSLNNDGNGTVDAAGSEKGEDRLKYIRGDQSHEGNSSGDFRVRETLLGDVINSDPWFSGTKDDFGYSVLSGTEGSSYNTFRVNKSSRKEAVFFGANDGMLHAINATTGAEFFTYVPNEVIPSLTRLTSSLYGCDGNGCLPHQYFVDGSPKVADAYFDSDWHTVLVAGLGAGGKAVFALDVTDPETFDENDVLWEVSTTQAYSSSDLSEFQDNLGYTIPQASIVRLNNDKWVAVVANGYDSTEKKAVLYLLDIESGEILYKFDTGVGSSATPNGLSTPIVVDINGDRKADYVYAGDLLGNLWKFDLSGNENQWDVAFSHLDNGNTVYDPLYKACNTDPCTSTNYQPITGKPQVGRHSEGGLMVYFGTGKYFEVSDGTVGASPQVHDFYAIRDLDAPVSGKNRLQAQEILVEKTLTFNNNDIEVRVTTDNLVDYEGEDLNGDGDYDDVGETEPQLGWYMDLKSPVNGKEGERVVVAPLLRGGRVIFVTMIPESDPCGWGGTSWLMELDAESGSRLDSSPFDINGDGDFTIDDFIAIADTNNDGNIDGQDEQIPTSGVRKKNMGIIKTPGVVVCEDGKECKYTSGTSGELDMIKESTDNPTGRQSWLQIK